MPFNGFDEDAFRLAARLVADAIASMPSPDDVARVLEKLP